MNPEARPIASLLARESNSRARGAIRVREVVKANHSLTWERDGWTFELERAPWDKTSEKDTQRHAAVYDLIVREGERVIFRDRVQCWDGSPVMVPDGTFDVQGNPRFREDPVEAARIDLAHTVKVVTKGGKELWVKEKPGTVSTFYADSSDGAILSHDNFADDYASARAGSAFFSVDNTGTAIKVGQRYNAGLTWYLLYEGFVGFDTSGIPDSDEITDAHVSLYIKEDVTSPDFTVVMYANDWGASLTSGDWVAGASLSGLTVVGSYPTSGFAVNSYRDLGGSGLAEEINPTGFTRVLIASSRLRDGNAPSGDEYFEFRASEQTGTTQDPKLVVTHEPALSEGTASLTLPFPIMTASGKQVQQATSALTLPFPVMTSEGDQVFQSTAALVLPFPVITAVGEYIPATREGNASLVLPFPILTATGSQVISGTGAFTLPFPILTASGTHTDLKGNASLVLPFPVMSASGTYTIQGSSSLILPFPIMTATGLKVYTATAGLVLPFPILEATGFPANVASASLVLPFPVLTASGTMYILGTAALTLPFPILTAQAFLILPIHVFESLLAFPKYSAVLTMPNYEATLTLPESSQVTPMPDL